MALKLVITFIILAVLLVVYFAFIQDYIINPVEDVSSCEKNGGECMVVCASGMTRMSAYNCEAEEAVCCMDTEDATGIPGTGLDCSDVDGGACVNESEDCPDDKVESTADCSEGKRCCKDDTSAASSECEQAGGKCMQQCPSDAERLQGTSCPDSEMVCCKQA